MLNLWKTLLEQPGDFWRFIHYVENLPHPQPLGQVREGYQAFYRATLADEQLREWIALLGQLGLNIDENSLHLPRPEDIPGGPAGGTTSFGQNLALRVRLCLMASLKDKIFYRHLCKYWNHLEEVYPLSDLQTLWHREDGSGAETPPSNAPQTSLAMALEKAMRENALLLLELKSGKRHTFFIHRWLIFNGHLGIVSEEVKSCSLLFLGLEQIVFWKACRNRDYRANFSSREVECFIHSMREMEDSEVRLILRIKDPGQVDLNHPHHFLGSPYVTANHEGELIWAASVEMSEALFRWLSSMRGNIEIIDPWELRHKFEEYCDNALFPRLGQPHKRFKKSS